MKYIKVLQYVFLCCSIPLATPREPVFTIKTVIGTATIRRQNVARWIPARIGMKLKQNDAIKTSTESKAKLTSSDGSVLEVEENTQIDFSKLNFDGGTCNGTVRIFGGKLLCDIKKVVNTKKVFSFETPTATAAIRGTRVDFEVSREKTVVTVHEGTVHVKPRKAEKGKNLTANQMTVVTNKTSQITVKPITAPEKSSVPTKQKQSLPSSEQPASTPQKKALPSTEKKDAPPAAPMQEEKPNPLRLEIYQPKQNQRVTTPSLTLSGKVYPGGAAVFINGTKVKTTLSGSFSGPVYLDNRDGLHTIMVSAKFNGHEKKNMITVDLKASNPDAPVLKGPYIQSPRICFSGSSRSKSSSLFFHRVIDGKVDSTTVKSNEQICITMKPGYHRYAAWLSDTQGNISHKWSDRLPMLPPGIWDIAMRRPQRNENIALQNQGLDPRAGKDYIVEFSISNLPQNDPSLIKEVTVENTLSREVKRESAIFQTDFRFQLRLIRGTNKIEIRVRDINNDIKTKRYLITLR